MKTNDRKSPIVGEDKLTLSDGPCLFYVFPNNLSGSRWAVFVCGFFANLAFAIPFDDHTQDRKSRQIVGEDLLLTLSEGLEVDLLDTRCVALSVIEFLQVPGWI